MPSSSDAPSAPGARPGPPVGDGSMTPDASPPSTVEAGRKVGRYVLQQEIAAGGMARVFVGRLVGPIRFSRTVAVKCLHPTYARDPEFVAMLMDEAHLASRVRHPNVVPTLDVVSDQGELFLVMEYVHGESLARLLREVRLSGERMPIPIAASIVTGLLFGLHAAHEARGEGGEPLGIVHRDVSPQNVLVGVDGVSRVLDFGIAKAASRVQHTADGQVKGKLRYMAPEQLRTQPIDRRTDVFAASAVLWEVLTGQRLFDGPDAGSIVTTILMGDIRRPGALVPAVSPELDAVVMRGLSRSPDGRFASAREMAVALEHAVTPATARQVGEWVERVGGEPLRQRGARIAALEHAPSGAPAAAARAEEPTAPLSRRDAEQLGLAPSPMRPGEDTDVSASRTAPRIDLGGPSPKPAEVTPPRSRGRGPLAAAAVLLLGLAGGALLMATLGEPSPPRAESAQAARPEEPSAPPPMSVEPPAPEDPAAASAASSEPAPAVASGSAAPRGVAPRRRIGCDPPYTIENGIKRFKKQCL